MEYGTSKNCKALKSQIVVGIPFIHNLLKSMANLAINIMQASAIFRLKYFFIKSFFEIFFFLLFDCPMVNF